MHILSKTARLETENSSKGNHDSYLLSLGKKKWKFSSRRKSKNFVRSMASMGVKNFNLLGHFEPGSITSAVKRFAENSKTDSTLP